MLIDISTFSYIFALVPALILTAICIILRKKPLKILMITFLGYIITVSIEKNIFPLRLGEMAMDSDDRLLFGFIAPIFHGFDITCMSPLVLIEAYWHGIVFGLLVGFISVLAVKPLRKFKYSALFIIILEVVLAVALIIPDIFSPVSKYFITSEFLMSILFYFVGFGLAKLVIMLIPGILKHIDNEKNVSNQKEMSPKIVL